PSGAGEPDVQMPPTQGEAPNEGAEPAGEPQAQPTVGGAGGPETEPDGPEAQPFEILDLVADAVNEIEEDLPDDQQYVTVIGQAPGTGFATEQTPVHRRGMELRARLLRHTMMARARLETLLKAETQSQSRYARKGRIVPSRLWKLQSGNMNVFRQTVEGQELDTAIAVLLDDSGSMRRTIATAIEAACFVPLALDDVPGVHTSIHVFPGYARASERLKGFGDRLTPCLDALASVEAHGGTPLARALNEVGGELMEFDVQRRILLLVTDGEPDSATAAEAELRRLEQAGVEIVGIGIGCSLKHLIRDFTNIKTVGDLTQSLYELLERKLLKFRAAA
ncbi:MAG: VWA domain-containing protein, partial [Rhodocyclaceae bacterium]|nr:VWA domain-containing protein [Rhodocyclaceae bacterium]